MPLICFDPDRNATVQSFQLSNHEWEQLKFLNRAKQHLRMICCDQLVVPKLSSKGTRFFAHRTRGDCQAEPESEKLLRIKYLVAKHLGDADWVVEVDHCGQTPTGEPWIADIFGRKDGRKLVIQIRLSPQNPMDIQQRQAHFAASGIQTCWLFGSSDFPIGKDCPAARIEPVSTETEFMVHVPHSTLCQYEPAPVPGNWQSVPLQRLIRALDEGTFLFGRPVDITRSVRTEIAPFEVQCWSCKKPAAVARSIALCPVWNSNPDSIGRFRIVIDLPSIKMTDLARFCTPKQFHEAGIELRTRAAGQFTPNKALVCICPACEASLRHPRRPQGHAEQAPIESYQRVSEEFGQTIAQAVPSGLAAWGIYEPYEIRTTSTMKKAPRFSFGAWRANVERLSARNRAPLN